MLKFTEVLGIKVVDFHASTHFHKWLPVSQNGHVSWNHELTWQVGPYWWLGGIADSDTFDCKNDLSEMTNVCLVGRYTLLRQPIHSRPAASREVL